MSDYDRGAYTPHHDAPLSFDARQARGRRGFPTTLVISLLVLVALAGAITLFYRSGVRGAGEAPAAVGSPVGQIKAPAPDGKAVAEGDNAGLQIYKSEGPPPAAASSGPVFAAGPEQPQPRPAPMTRTAPAAAPPASAPPVAVAPAVAHAVPATPATPAPSSAMVAASGATMPAAPAKAKPASGDAIGDLLHAKPAAPAKPAPAVSAAPVVATAPAPHGAAVVQIGAYSSNALAAKGWSDVAAAYGADMSGKGKLVEPVDHEGKTLFRTAISGFGSRADAVAFCLKLKRDGHACIVK